MVSEQKSLPEQAVIRAAASEHTKRRLQEVQSKRKTKSRATRQRRHPTKTLCFASVLAGGRFHQCGRLLDHAGLHRCTFGSNGSRGQCGFRWGA